MRFSSRWSRDMLSALPSVAKFANIKHKRWALGNYKIRSIWKKIEEIREMVKIKRINKPARSAQ